VTAAAGVAPAPSPSVAALKAAFGPAILRSQVSCGDTIVWMDQGRAHDILAWLRDTPAQSSTT
jgi:plastocyanin